jgi:predicted ribosome quality control (RQC) complex YloA/Tae2 family protein
MKAEINTRKSIQDNAADYYDRAKKIKSKIAGLRDAIETTKKLIEQEEKKHSELPEKKIARQKEWFEKFHYFNTSGGFLVLGGKDAKSNDIVVGRHMEKNDIYFHADITGAPSVVMKNGQGAPEQDLREAAQFAGSFSSAWKNELGAVDVFHVTPDQVKTGAKAGEYLAKGSFVIAGKKNYFKKVPLELAIAYIDEKLVIAPLETIARRTTKHICIKPAREPKGESAKKILHKLKELFPGAQIDLDWVQQILPTGGSKIIK